jgi:hypothetical protein
MRCPGHIYFIIGKILLLRIAMGGAACCATGALAPVYQPCAQGKLGDI